MEAAPPSYEHSTLVGVWDLVARYTPSKDLCSAALVCSKWHAIFIPYIWGNPASHFGIEDDLDDSVFVALTRFKRTLQTARLLVRTLTHTLHLPPAHAEIYSGPHSDWLRDVLERLPNLQSLIVRGLPFFDYAALQAVIHMRPKRDADLGPASNIVELPGSFGSFSRRPSAVVPSFGLRLLDASRCQNITSSSLAAALGRFEGLLYLDLSFTYPARERCVLESMKKTLGIQVLKLRGIHLKDDGAKLLSESIGLRVRSLDVRDNYITDQGVRCLLEASFMTGGGNANGVEIHHPAERSPILLPHLGSEMLEIYQGEDFESYLRNTFTGSFVSRLAIEDAPAGGITHLYIAGNLLSVEGLSALIKSGRLHVLDAGAVGNDVDMPFSQRLIVAKSSMNSPGLERPPLALAEHAAGSLTFVRVGHSLITNITPVSHDEEVVHGRVELGDTSLPFNTNVINELDATTVRPGAVELPADRQSPRYELEGDPMRVVASPARDTTFQIANPADHVAKARRGSILAPEVVPPPLPDLSSKAQLSPLSATEEGSSTFGTSDAVSSMSPGFSTGSSPETPALRPRSYSSMAIERQARINAHKAISGDLHPAMLPHIKTLILTEVPPFSPNGNVADSIIGFIKNCAIEEAFARKQALLDYSAPPGRKGHSSALRHSMNRIFALKRVVLELAPEQDCQKSKASPWQHKDTRSVTEDRDSEILWSAAETDFSFFGDEEVAFPTIETGRNTVGSGADEKEVTLSPQEPCSRDPQVPIKADVDNIALIYEFRKGRKAAQQRSLEMGHVNPEIEGLWNGVIEIIRPYQSSRSDEELDYYGNKFTKSWHYR